jgi:hypothetical protein
VTSSVVEFLATGPEVRAEGKYSDIHKQSQTVVAVSSQFMSKLDYVRSDYFKVGRRLLICKFLYCINAHHFIFEFFMAVNIKITIY